MEQVKDEFSVKGEEEEDIEFSSEVTLDPDLFSPKKKKNKKLNISQQQVDETWLSSLLGT